MSNLKGSTILNGNNVDVKKMAKCLTELHEFEILRNAENDRNSENIQDLKVQFRKSTK